MKLKKIASLIMACVMVLSLSVTAFATANTAEVTDLSEGAELEVSGTTEGATIRVVVPTSSAIVLNPYEAEVTKTVNGTELTKVKDQLLSTVQKIENQSTLPITVGIKVTGQAEGEAKLVDAIANDSTTKDVVLTFQYEAAAATATALTSSADELTLKDKEAVEAEGNYIPGLDAKDGAKPNLLFKFDGEANKSAEKAWTSEDVVSATVVFTFAVDTDSID